MGNKLIFRSIFICLLALLLWTINCDNSSTGNDNQDNNDTLATGDTSGTIIADHIFAIDPSSIPLATLDQIRSTYNIYYGHTSHGSQIVTGLNMLESVDSRYDLPNFHEISDDLGHNGDTSWVPLTRVWLNAHPEYNMVMWSWCGGCSDNTETGINTYLTAMTNLENDYPGVIFIYMTGHLDGTGTDGNLYQCNNQIRDYCNDNGKILFDFADIESYDPDGTYYPDESDGCSWCADWCAEHNCESCGGCAHSHCFNCYQKGKAFWWMMVEILDQ